MTLHLKFFQLQLNKFKFWKVDISKPFKNKLLPTSYEAVVA